MGAGAAERREKLRATLRAGQVDAVLVSVATNVGYLTGFSGEDSALVLTGARAVVVSDGRYATQLARECPDLEVHIRPVAQTLTAAVAEVVGKLAPRALAFEAAGLTVADLHDLQAAQASLELRPTRGWVEALRVIKDDAEVVAIREAIGFAERAFERLLAEAKPEWTEKELADELEFAMRRLGATAASFAPIVAVGANAALPHYRPGASVRLGDAEFVLIDWGASGRPYKSDLTRVVTSGKVSPKLEQVHRAVLAAQRCAFAAIRPGVKAGNVDAEARSAIAEAGFGGLFLHGLGHGLGRDIHEAPRLRQGSDDTLQAGMVLTVEPGVYLPGWGGVRVEDDVLVTPDGCELLSRLPPGLAAFGTAAG
jgi:Xaa-Pro aminopeptidase